MLYSYMSYPSGSAHEYYNKYSIATNYCDSLRKKKTTTTKKTKQTWKWVELTSPPSWLTVAPSPSRTCTTFCLPYITPTCNGVKPSYVENMKSLTEYNFLRQILFVRKKQESEQRNEIPWETDLMREIWTDCMQCNSSLS